MPLTNQFFDGRQLVILKAFKQRLPYCPPELLQRQLVGLKQPVGLEQVYAQDTDGHQPEYGSDSCFHGLTSGELPKGLKPLGS